MNKNELQPYNKMGFNYPVTTNLLVKDIKENQLLSPQSKDIIIASKCYPKISARKDELITEGEFIGIEVRQFEIRQHVNKAILDSGFGASLSPEDISELINSVIKDVLVDFSHLTTKEVGIAFKNGCRELYGEYMGVNTRIFYKWLKTYCEVSKLKANQELIKIDSPKTVEVSETEKINRRNKWLNTFFIAFDEFVKTGSFDIYDTENMFYDYLKELKLIIGLKGDDRKKILLKAEELVRSNYNPLKAKDKFQRNDFLVVIEKIKNKDKSIELEINSAAKHIHLKMYMEQLKNKKLNLKDVVTKKNNP